MSARISSVSTVSCSQQKPFGRVLTVLSAPIVEDVGVKWSPQMFNGSFKEKTIYREDPSPEVDEAWDALGVDCKKTSHAKSKYAYVL